MEARMPSLAGRNVVITGAGGLIGAAVTRALVECQAAVRALLGPSSADVASPPDSIQGVYGEVDNPGLMTDLVRQADVVIHLAGPPSVAGSFTAPVEYARVHTMGTVTLLEACRQHGVSRFLYISSAEVYGQPAVNPVPEDHPLCPRSPYGAAKVSGEAFVQAFTRASAMEAVILRPFSIFGPGTPTRSVLGTIVTQACRGEAIQVMDGRPVRDYCFIDDLVDVILLCSTAPLPQSCRVYNIGSGIGTSVSCLARRVLDALGRDLPMLVVPRRDRPPVADILELVSDPTRAHRELGWHTKISLKVGLQRLLRETTASREGI
jgi:nucleoside-diphosphate-sugar epimerase